MKIAACAMKQAAIRHLLRQHVYFNELIAFFPRIEKEVNCNSSLGSKPAGICGDGVTIYDTSVLGDDIELAAIWDLFGIDCD